MEVDIGLRSILRRLLQGAVPRKLIRALQQPIAPNSIRWDFCNIVEADPQRRLRLNISHDKLELMHPADLADIVEELGPAEREAIFETIDSEVAADALSEMDSKTQASILESLEPDVAADIVEEMSPDEAADALGELEEETSQEILEEMEQDDKTEVTELLEFEEDTAGGLMNTEYASLPDTATVADAMVDAAGKRRAAGESQPDPAGGCGGPPDRRGPPGAPVPGRRRDAAEEPGAGSADLGAGRHEPGARHRAVRQVQHLHACRWWTKQGILSGVITADDIISVLRQK